VINSTAWSPYWEWEDYRAGMYDFVDPSCMLRLSKEAVIRMSDTETWYEWMRAVITKWPISSAYNLQCVTGGRRAWIGQAAMCLWVGQKSAVTRNAWWRLDEKQQRVANLNADGVIESFLGNQQLEMFT